MGSYINILIRCGYSPDQAYKTCRDFMKNFSIDDLEEFILSIRNDGHVD